MWSPAPCCGCVRCRSARTSPFLPWPRSGTAAPAAVPGTGDGRRLSAFEVMWEDFYRLVDLVAGQGRPVLPYGQPYYVLVEALGADPDVDARRFEQVLGDALEAGEIVDAAIAKSGAERRAMWALRDDVVQVGRNAPIFTFDVSLKISDMEAYVAEIRGALRHRWPETASLMVFGHLGDGNLHVIAGVGDRAPETRHAVEELVYRPLQRIGGSISAEHGVGHQKRDFSRCRGRRKKLP